jgi:uncharacterized protein YbjT (DUF2867 family)
MIAGNSKQACIFGGTGFIGRQIVRELAKSGYMVRVATRVPEKAFFLKPAGNVGQIIPFPCNYSQDDDIAAAIRGCDVVINCIGILYEKKKGDFVKIHTDLPRRISLLCKSSNIPRFIHISALGCDKALSQHGQSKIAGERAIFENFASASILRPSVVFGAEDNFFNMFAKLSVILPFLPLIGGGITKFQPVFVGDVCDAVMACLKNNDSIAKVYELGGPEILDFKQIYQRMFDNTHRKKLLVPVPWGVAKIQGAVLGMLPAPLLTKDQVLSLKTDTIVSPNALSFKDLGITPTPMESVLPQYLARYQPGGRFGNKKRA